MILGVPARPGLRIMVASKPVDYRNGMDSLAALVMQALAADPFTGDVFIFRSTRSDRLKLLVWGGSGLCLITKRLETGAFTLAAGARRGDYTERAAASAFVHRHGLEPTRRPPSADAGRIERGGTVESLAKRLPGSVLFAHVVRRRSLASRT